MLDDVLKVKAEKILMPVKNVGRISSSTCTDEPLMIFSPPGESWVEVLGHRFEGVNGFEGLIEYLNKYREVERELNELLNQKMKIIDYLITKLEEAKLMAVYEDGVRYPSYRETIYQEILDKFFKESEE